MYLNILIYSPLQELRLRFLACREEWVAGLVAELEEGGAYEFLKRLTDVYRLHLFDVIMQFRAIFSDDSSQQVDSDSGVRVTLGFVSLGFRSVSR